MRRPEVEVAEQVGQAGHVVGRHADEHGLVGAGAAELDRADDVGGQVAVAQHGGLGGGGGAAGVEEDGGAVTVGRHRPAARPTAPGGRHERLGVDDPVAPGGEGGGDRALGHDEHVAEGSQHLGELLVAEPVVEGYVRHSSGRRREQAEGEGEPVGADVGEGVGARRLLGPGPGAGEQLGGGQASRPASTTTSSPGRPPPCRAGAGGSRLGARQSEAGSGFAPLSGRGRPSTVRAPRRAGCTAARAPARRRRSACRAVGRRPGTGRGRRSRRAPAPRRGAARRRSRGRPRPPGPSTTTTCASDTALRSFCPGRSSMEMPFPLVRMYCSL